MTALLEIKDLVVEFSTPGGTIRAANAVSYDVNPGEIVAVVGESGSGKSVTALSILRLIPDPPGRVCGGEILFQGENLLQYNEEQIRQVRGRRIGMIFQEPMTSLNPVLSIGRQMTEAMRLHLGLTAAQADAKAIDLLKLVGISDPESRLKAYPHHLSGGMRQRVMIAMALSCDPPLIIADEPTTALDVTIQAQILELMKDLCRRLGVALVIITHNLGIVARYADRVNVMYAGRVVERGGAREIYRRPSHPYTIGLLNSVPRLDRPRGSPLDPIPGNPPDLTLLPSGCAFQPRCTHCTAHCAAEAPALLPLGQEHWSACFESEGLYGVAAK
ncbi:ABC transporter ATP-binding protein [Pelagibius litoralis]|uniref:ABC transporter ATP-binding protein n=1 Tax=Pelagibius litoralis TaxID=374515 RepID=A0A967C2J1_9PROT|nr:ABC transporter ATP-binding protein [Pelagibius litoralis]NIA67119.1 ABC transporter ATP-binding protein [Pelagibius litoralis]